VQVDPVLCVGAFSALSAGDSAAHDRIVIEQVRQLMSRNDVVILAQASMARVASSIPAADQVVPILSSPRLAIEKLSGVLSGL
jgi:hypothetical protein